MPRHPQRSPQCGLSLAPAGAVSFCPPITCPPVSAPYSPEKSIPLPPRGHAMMCDCLLELNERGQCLTPIKLVEPPRVYRTLVTTPNSIKVVAPVVAGEDIQLHINMADQYVVAPLSRPLSFRCRLPSSISVLWSPQAVATGSFRPRIRTPSQQGRLAAALNGRLPVIGVSRASTCSLASATSM